MIVLLKSFYLMLVCLLFGCYSYKPYGIEQTQWENLDSNERKAIIAQTNEAPQKTLMDLFFSSGEKKTQTPKKEDILLKQSALINLPTASISKIDYLAGRIYLEDNNQFHLIKVTEGKILKTWKVGQTVSIDKTSILGKWRIKNCDTQSSVIAKKW